MRQEFRRVLCRKCFSVGADGRPALGSGAWGLTGAEACVWPLSRLLSMDSKYEKRHDWRCWVPAQILLDSWFRSKSVI